MLTPEDFVKAGYRKFDNVKYIKDFAAYGLQKLISDSVGKRYYITVYVYDNREIKQKINENMPDFSLLPDCQFRDGEENEMFVNIELVLHKDNTIEDIEQKFDTIWKALGCIYYEKFH